MAQRNDRESGQALVSFALMMTAMMGMLAVVVDLGLLYGQRRFDQNGADAAALAAARMLAGQVTPLPDSGGRLYFSVPEADIYREVRYYAGLDPNSASPVPTGRNQNAGLTGRNRLAVTLEYWDGARWCYSPSGAPPPRAGAQACTLLRRTIEGHDVDFPPAPVPGKAYRVRVTVSSTTNGFFAQVIGANNGSPLTPVDQSTPACLRATDTTGQPAAGNVTCAHAVASIRGNPDAVSKPPLIPPTTGHCQVEGDDSDGDLFQLWGSNPENCGYNLPSWKNLLDFSDESTWCNSAGDWPRYDYTYTKLMPRGARTAPGSSCSSGPIDNSWRRDPPDDRFEADPNRAGDSDIRTDVPYWIIRGFKGIIRPDTFTGVDGNGNPVFISDGARFPTYERSLPDQGATLGTNVSDSFYCGSGIVTTITCSLYSTGSYFFAQNQEGFHWECPDWWGRTFGVGCRDAAVVLWDEPQWPDAQGNCWRGTQGCPGGGGGAGPVRLRARQIWTFTLYCGRVNTLCNDPPRAVVGNASSASVWGRFKAWLPTDEPLPDPNGLCINGNCVSLQ